MEILRFGGAAVLGTVAVLLLRQTRGEIAPAVRTAAVLCLLGGGIALLAPVIARLRTLADAALGEEGAILWRSVAVAAVTRVCGEGCRALGEPSVADALDFAGHATLTVLALPLLERLIDAALGLMR